MLASKNLLPLYFCTVIASFSLGSFAGTIFQDKSHSKKSLHIETKYGSMPKDYGTLLAVQYFMQQHCRPDANRALVNAKISDLLSIISSHVSERAWKLQHQIPVGKIFPAREERLKLRSTNSALQTINAHQSGTDNCDLVFLNKYIENLQPKYDPYLGAPKIKYKITIHHQKLRSTQGRS